jgi:hypothetical protein
MPWTKRDSPSATGPPESANARLAIASTARPARTPRFGPMRPTSSPPGTPPTSDPAPYAPSRSPASSFVRSYVSAKWGRSGMIAPKSIASRKTTVPVRATMRRIVRAYGRRIATKVVSDPGRTPGGPKKMHRVGLASVQLTRSTLAEATAGRESLQPSALRARCTRKPTGAFVGRQAPSRVNLSQIATIRFVCRIRYGIRVQAEPHRGGGSFVRPPNRPPPKRLPVGGPSTSGAPSSVHTGHYGPVRAPSSGNRSRNTHFAMFFIRAARACVPPPVLYH